MNGHRPIPGKVLGSPPREGTAVVRPIDTSTLGPIKIDERSAVTRDRLATMVKSLWPGERLTITRLRDGKLRIVHAREQIDEAPTAI